MELRHLRYFVVVAEEQNVTRAAARLHVSQPPLSRQIRDLEEELGVALFERSAKSVRLTEAGRVFLEEARAVLQRSEEAVQTVKAVATGNKGDLHIGYAPSLTVEILPKILRAFQEDSPGIRVHLHDASTAEMLDCLRSDKLHVALMIRPSPRAMDHMQFIELRRYNICIAAHPSHPCARQRRVRLADLARERLITYSEKDYPEYHEMLAALFRKNGNLPVIAEEHDSSTSLIAAVESGRGIAVVPQSMACLVGQRLKLLPILPAPPSLVVGIATRNKGLSSAMERFVSVAKEIND